MSRFATITRKGTEPIPSGCPVRAKGKGCAIAHDLAEMIGVARRAATPEGWAKGEAVIIQTEGGLRVQLAANATILLGGIERLLMAGDPHYFELRGGKVSAAS